MKALLVIDMQNVCVGENHAEFFRYDNTTLLNSVNAAIADNENNLVVYIRNIMKKSLLNKFAPFQAYEGTPEVELVEGLNIVSDYVFDKYTGDAFSNKELLGFLKERAVDEIEVVGVDGGGCVALTALGAVKNGFRVTVNTKAVGTMFDKNEEKYYKKLKEQGARFI